MIPSQITQQCHLCHYGPGFCFVCSALFLFFVFVFFFCSVGRFVMRGLSVAILDDYSLFSSPSIVC